MAKSIRSKVKKRFRTAKRVRVEHLINRPNREACAKGLAQTAAGLGTSLRKKEFVGTKNAFLYPTDPEAEIPQSSVKTPIDFRSEAMPMAAYAFVGNRRKYTDSEKADQEELKKKHDPIRILAGKGAEKKQKKAKSSTAKDAKMGGDEDQDMSDDSSSELEDDVSPELKELSRKICKGEITKEEVRKTEKVDSSRRPVLNRKTGKKMYKKQTSGAGKKMAPSVGGKDLMKKAK